MGLTKVKKTFQIDSADRDTTKYSTNGDCVVYLPRVYENVSSLRLKGGEFTKSFVNSASIPTTIGGLALWLDAADSSSIVLNGSNVIQWKDKSGNRNHASGSAYPTYVANSNVVSFDGTQYLDSPMSVGPNYTFFTVARITNTGSRRIVNGGGSTSDKYFTIANLGTSMYVATLSGNGADWNNAAAVNTTNTVNSNVTSMITAVNSNGTMSPYYNGASQDTRNGTNPGFTGLNSGGAYTDNAFKTLQCMSGYICEIIAYSNALTDPQRRQIELYLSRKWGIQSATPSDTLFNSLYYFLIELEGLNKSDETRVGGDKSSFIDKYFAKIPMNINSSNILTYNDKNFQENIANYTPSIEKLDRLHIKLRTHSQQDGSGFIYFGNDYNLTFEIEYLENQLDDVKIDEN